MISRRIVCKNHHEKKRIPVNIPSVIILGTPSGISEVVPPEISSFEDSYEILKVPLVVLSQVPPRFPSGIFAGVSSKMSTQLLLEFLQETIFEFLETLEFFLGFSRANFFLRTRSSF